MSISYTDEVLMAGLACSTGCMRHISESNTGSCGNVDVISMCDISEKVGLSSGTSTQQLFIKENLFRQTTKLS